MAPLKNVRFEKVEAKKTKSLHQKSLEAPKYQERKRSRSAWTHKDERRDTVEDRERHTALRHGFPSSSEDEVFETEGKSSRTKDNSSDYQDNYGEDYADEFEESEYTTDRGFPFDQETEPYTADNSESVDAERRRQEDSY